MLCSWYFFLMIDRWIHFDQRASVAYGYIVFVTLIESLRVLSAVIFAWGNYKVVWVEVETRFDEIWQGRLWTSAKFVLFVVSLVSIFYAVLYVALAGAWLDFLSLNSIADIATKRTSFEVATAALLTVFALLAFGSAYYAIRYQSRKVDGKGNNALEVSFVIWFLFKRVSLLTYTCLEPLVDTRCDVPILHEIPDRVCASSPCSKPGGDARKLDPGPRCLIWSPVVLLPACHHLLCFQGLFP